ncbi:MAG TPA: class I SAM-dependent methyltransferase [Candidatus Acidoferrales bacterium]|nr:class I SAM-dependent methyltransferase [Candidatus Acidoferrales bacterium]
MQAAAERYARSSEWLALRNLLPVAPGKAIDIGAGRGIVSYALARAGWRVIAAEPDRSPVVGTAAISSLAQSTGIRIEVIESPGESIPCDSNSFDLVHCRAVLHHAADLGRFCREVARILVPGGLFIATREHVISRNSDREMFLAHHPLHRLFGGENAYMLSTYLEAITRAGLRIQRVLNPFESDINLFPSNTAELRQHIARRLRLKKARYIPTALLGWLGRFNNTPGRLYTFVASKR